MPRLTQHARDRWQERFGEYNLEKEFSQAIPFGGQYHDDQSLLAPCGAVFIVSPSQSIKTVLTREQALGNIQSRMPVHRQHQSTLAPQLPAAATRISLEELAAEHAQRFPNRDYRRVRNRELQTAGYNPSDPVLQSRYQDLYWAEIRRLKSDSEIL